jgi:phosphoribosylanthranilate isomerase
VASGTELTPGRKDPDKMHAFAEAVAAAGAAAGAAAIQA